MAGDDGETHHEHRSSHHFLVVPYGIQSHTNPARVLAHRLTRLNASGSSILATLAVSVGAHRRLFPSLAGAEEEAAAAASDGVVPYVPYSDSFDDGSHPKSPEEWDRSIRATSRNLSAILTRFAAGGRPVTCVICTLVVPGVLDVVREHGVPLVVYWIQPATVLAAYYHYFHGYDDLIAAHAAANDSSTREVRLPGLLGRRRPLRVRDLPSCMVDTHTDDAKKNNGFFKELYDYMDQCRPRVLVNSCYDLEPDALAEMKRHLGAVFPVAPMVGSSSAEAARIHLFKHDDIDKKRYMEWLGAHRERSVVYASFGCITKCTKLQMEEVLRGLRRCGRPYLLVVRKDGVEDDDGDHGSLEITQDQLGMVVDWCDQLEVLSHPAVGCFVTHCGWNSTLEAVASGVPMVGVPWTFDQPTNMYLVEVEWMVGTRGERNSEGVLTGAELARRIELVMGEGTVEAVAMRERAGAMKEMVRETASAGGFAERSLRDFVESFQAPLHTSCVMVEQGGCPNHGMCHRTPIKISNRSELLN